MHRHPLLEALDQYGQTWAAGLAPYRFFDRTEEKANLSRLKLFVLENSNCFDRNPPGHITGSAMIVSPKLDRVLLTLHRKLGKWLQLGGHSDGENLTLGVALREAQEESGINELDFFKYETIFGPDIIAPLIIDLDIHEIPACSKEEAHLHYDVRFLITTKGNGQPRISEESSELAWHTLSAAYALNGERSMQRQFDKIAHVAQRLNLV